MDARLEVKIVNASGTRLLKGNPVLEINGPVRSILTAERVALMRLARGLSQARGMAVLFTEHDMDVVFGVADRIIVLSRGEVIAQGDGATIRADARVRAVYLGSGSTTGGH